MGECKPRLVLDVVLDRVRLWPRDDLEREEAVEGACDTRRDTAGEGGAGRLDTRVGGDFAGSSVARAGARD